MSVTVKPIVWGKTSYGRPEAKTIVGICWINEAGNGGWTATIKNETLRDVDGRTNFATIEAAKAAIFASFEARILSAIEVSE